MNSRSVVSTLRDRFARLARDDRGVSAVEFAMLLPLMVALYLGGVETSQAIAVDRKVTIAARAVADLVAQAKSVSSSDLYNIMDSAKSIVAPYPDTKLRGTVSCLSIDAQGNVTTVWKYDMSPNGGVTSSKTAADAVKGSIKIPNTYLIWGQIDEYKPIVGYLITGTLTLRDEILMRPRLSEDVKKT